MSRKEIIAEFKAKIYVNFSLDELKKYDKVISDLEKECLIRFERKLSPLYESDTIFTYKWIGS